MSTQKREFIELGNASGWSQARIARQLELTRGGVKGIITGSSLGRANVLDSGSLPLLLRQG